MTLRFHSVFLLLAFFSCNNKNKQRVLVDDAFAEGNITKDTVYNGLIKFYDTATNRLIMTANYKSGILDGERIEYYKNGNPKLKLNYENGKTNGELTIFDSSGNVFEKQNFYYNLRVGPSFTLKKGKPSQYYFYSLENKELLHIDYDSIQGKRIEQLNDTSFFFWHLNNFISSESKEQQTELFLYLPNPPRLNFKYSLCIIDDAYIVKQIAKEFNSDKSWDVITLDYQSLKNGYKYAIKLTVDDEFDNDDGIATMFKKL